MRPEATGYGTVYFAQEMLERHGMGFPDARVSISGSGNVAQYAAVKSMELGARVVTLSDSEGPLVVEQEIGRASCRERVCQYVEIAVVDGALKKKKTKNKENKARKKEEKKK